MLQIRFTVGTKGGMSREIRLALSSRQNQSSHQADVIKQKAWRALIDSYARVQAMVPDPVHAYEPHPGAS